jgi:hypothetical protein
LAQASGFLGDSNQVRAGEAGHSRLVVKGEEASAVWHLAIGPLSDAVTVDGKQCIAAAQEFGRVDDALVGALTGRTP